MQAGGLAPGSVGDDLDDFLYGEEGGSLAPANAAGSSGLVPGGLSESDDDGQVSQRPSFLQAQETHNATQSDTDEPTLDGAGLYGGRENSLSADDGDNDDDDDDDDDDVDIVLEAHQQSDTATDGLGVGGPLDVGLEGASLLDSTATATVIKPTKASEGLVASETKPYSSTVNVYGPPALYEGKPITEVPLSAFEDRPWCQPGADVTDFFNYGFNEETWNQYCQKQRHMRGPGSLPQRRLGSGVLTANFPHGPQQGRSMHGPPMVPTQAYTHPNGVGLQSQQHQHQQQQQHPYQQQTGQHDGSGFGHGMLPRASHIPLHTISHHGQQSIGSSNNGPPQRSSVPTVPPPHVGELPPGVRMREMSHPDSAMAHSGFAPRSFGTDSSSSSNLPNMFPHQHPAASDKQSAAAKSPHMHLGTHDAKAVNLNDFSGQNQNQHPHQHPHHHHHHQDKQQHLIVGSTAPFHSSTSHGRATGHPTTPLSPLQHGEDPHWSTSSSHPPLKGGTSVLVSSAAGTAPRDRVRTRNSRSRSPPSREYRSVSTEGGKQPVQYTEPTKDRELERKEREKREREKTEPREGERERGLRDRDHDHERPKERERARDRERERERVRPRDRERNRRRRD